MTEAEKCIHEFRLVLDDEHASGLVAHRQKLRKPLTAYAARLLSRRLALFVDPNRAAEVIIERGWLSIEPEWKHGLHLKSVAQAAFDESLLESFGGRVQIPFADPAWEKFPLAFQGKDGSRWVNIRDFEEARKKAN